MKTLYKILLFWLFYSICAYSLKVPWDLNEVKSGDKFVIDSNLELNIEGLLGTGAHGNVYSGHYAGQEVAIKHATGMAAKSVQNEALTLQRLRGTPGVVKYITDFVDNKGNILLVMEKQYPLKGGLTVNIDLNFLKSALSSLKAIHDKFYLHGDIKPDNLLLSNTGNLIFIDFAGSVRSGTGAVPASTKFYSRRFQGSEQGDLRSLAIALLEIKHQATLKQPFWQMMEEYDEKNKTDIDSKLLELYSKMDEHDLRRAAQSTLLADFGDEALRKSLALLVAITRDKFSEDRFFNELKLKLMDALNYDHVDELLFNIIDGKISSIQDAISSANKFII